MIKKIITKTIFAFFVLFNSLLYAADDVAGMASISSAAGSSAQAAADQLATDAGKVTANIGAATEAIPADVVSFIISCIFIFFVYYNLPML